MKKTTIYLIIIILLLAIIGFFAYQHFNESNQIIIGNTTFKIPSGFSQGTLNEVNDINLTNGTYDVFIHMYNDTNIERYTGEYLEYKSTVNTTGEIDKCTINNITVYKYKDVNLTDYNHYWFVHNGKTYCIYTHEINNPNLEKIVNELISSIE